MTETKKSETKKISGFKLPRNKLILAPIRRISRGTPVSHETAFKFKGSFEKVGIPIEGQGGRARFFNIFNSKEEKEYLENILGENFNLNDLNNSFLNSFRVTLNSELQTFNLSDPLDYISTLVLAANKEIICTNPEERMNKATYKWLLSESGFQEAEREEIGNRKVALYAYYNDSKNNREELVSFLKLSGKFPPASADIKWIRGKVLEEIESNPTKSYILINDPDKKYKVLFDKALEVRAIFYSSDEGYIMKHRTVPFATNKANAILFLKNKKNQEDVAEIKAMIDQYNIKK